MPQADGRSLRFDGGLSDRDGRLRHCVTLLLRKASEAPEGAILDDGEVIERLVVKRNTRKTSGFRADDESAAEGGERSQGPVSTTSRRRGGASAGLREVRESTE